MSVAHAALARECSRCVSGCSCCPYSRCVAHVCTMLTLRVCCYLHAAIALVASPLLMLHYPECCVKHTHNCPHTFTSCTQAWILLSAVCYANPCSTQSALSTTSTTVPMQLNPLNALFPFPIDNSVAIRTEVAESMSIGHRSSGVTERPCAAHWATRVLTWWLVGICDGASLPTCNGPNPSRLRPGLASC